MVADRTLASQLGCEEGRQFIILRGERRRWGPPQEAPIARVCVGERLVVATVPKLRVRRHRCSVNRSGSSGAHTLLIGRDVPFC